MTCKDCIHYDVCHRRINSIDFLPVIKGKVSMPDENPDDYSFIQALVTDNTALMESQPDYIEQLKNLPEKQKQIFLYGSWDVDV